MTDIAIRNVSKIFGGNWKAALAMTKDGADKAEILAKTGCSVGLDDVSLDIAGSRIFVIMGLSGSGKSTLVRHINRLIEPTSGEILVGGSNVLDLNAKDLRDFRNRRVSMVFQNFGLMPHRTVMQNVVYGQRVRGLSKAEANPIGMQWIETVGLAGYENKMPHQLSGGMKQRVGLARALAADTDVILMDEAFSALDPLIRADMQDQLLQLEKNLSKTIVFITHDLDEALRIGAQIAILKDGKLVQVGTPDDILNRPANDYVARFVQRRTGAAVAHHD
ncbi:glycine betaine/L-proline ABC transporter ATP-binding protein [Agrobacterium sp. O3.4]|uniref:Quaternary amine transport ATP-binding protein n=2 Tax=Rhizobium/Agrobacterium group TaxID=227290 RepID=A0AA88JQY6_RHIRH|nr:MULTISPECIES: glycine betaine/L-proline ABC transporter ATP-binding protein [Rhizobium/Agrobacterium group]KAA3498691.1 glycine betaine/L-proline ABC transporter ATP-binding protein [Rhizobium rhizogenes]MCZ7471045.1 glycine betaine/L-proline ABC transporter ATP-binding protein [Rhizobium rhizogenes]MCZ7486255.1 glycine betaine/L-proline ABC transporter ATP-binding protein [Rhizobium rhizogenes]MDA5634768.1 glycine betaine/L-proline ABC transporter ATP-binding protein [Agrobacterium sp. ST15